MSPDNSISLGEFLRQERERRGITIEQLASATKISVRLLHSLETDRYADLPAKPFIRGFVTSYARFIGLDAQEVLSRFDRFIDEKAHERPSREGGHSGYAFERREGEQSRTMLWIVMGSFLVIGGVAVALFKPIRHHHGSRLEKLREAHASATPASVPSPLPSIVAAALSSGLRSPSPAPSAASGIPVAVLTPARPEPAKTQAPDKPASAATAEPSPTPSPAPSPSVAVVSATQPEASPSPEATEAQADEDDGKPDPLNSGINLKPSQIKYKIILKTAGDIWVRYRADDRPLMKFILRSGKVLVLRAERLIRLQVSNGQVVSIIYNGGRWKAPDPENLDATGYHPETFIFPKEQTKKYATPFPSEKPLPESVPQH